MRLQINTCLHPFANKYIFKYHSDNFMSYNSLKDYPFGNVHSSPAIRPQDSEMVEVERALKCDILFPNKDQGSVARSKGRANHWLRSMET